MGKHYLGDPTYYSDYGTRAQAIVGNIKSRAKKKGIPFDLDWHWFMDRYERGVCEATGIPFEEPQYTGKKGAASPWTPSVDRIDPDKGYTKDNCQLVVWIYNLSKNRFTHEDLVQFCRAFLVAESLRRKNNT